VKAAARAVADVSWLDLTTIRTMDYCMKAWRTRVALRFPRDKLSTKTPARVRSELLDVAYRLEELEIIENVDKWKDDLVCERDSQDNNRLNAKIPVDVVNGLHVFAGRLDLIL
jgi:phage tail sheath gpL-like